LKSRGSLCERQKAIFALELLNSCASRCYFAMFQATVVTPGATGFRRDTWSHVALQVTFTNELIHRRKIYPRKLAEYLNRTLFRRNIADYGEAEISQRRAKQLVHWAGTFVAKVEEVSGYDIG